MIDRLVAALRDALKDDTVKKRFADLGAEPHPLDHVNPAWPHKHLKTEIDKWAPLIRQAGVYAD